MKAEEAIVIEATCHCGAVRIRVPALPDYLIDCNCSICRRNGALWALYPCGSIEIAADPSSVTEYVWGSATIRTMHCRTGGSTTHWLPLIMPSDGNGGVNARLFDSSLVRGLRIRRFDGADTWTYLD
jgi:hypothetical protein